VGLPLRDLAAVLRLGSPSEEWIVERNVLTGSTKDELEERLVELARLMAEPRVHAMDRVHAVDRVKGKETCRKCLDILVVDANLFSDQN